jgi:hypothetical protein
MCDYSLAGLSSRLAVKGERLVVRQFPSGCLGMSAPRRRWYEFLFPSFAMAVCVPPGARLLLKGIPALLQEQLDVSAIEEVTFVQRTADAFTHRDGVRFTNGREILLQQLECGQQVTVLKVDWEDEADLESSDWPVASGNRARKVLLGSATGYQGPSRSIRGRQYVASTERR